jgi:hypothetical protein
VKYSDGLEGTLSLKKLLARKEFEKLGKKSLEGELQIDPESGDVILFGEIKLCKVAMHEMLRLKKQMEKIGIFLNDE